jgi:hypothetical protein
MATTTMNEKISKAVKKGYEDVKYCFTKRLRKAGYSQEETNHIRAIYVESEAMAELAKQRHTKEIIVKTNKELLATRRIR